MVHDVYVHNPTGERKDYVFDGDWVCPGLETAVDLVGTVDDRTDRDEGWSVEVVIPFAALAVRGGRSPEAGEEWLINFNRLERSPTEEYISWSPTYKDPADFHFTPRFGRIRFLR